MINNNLSLEATKIKQSDKCDEDDSCFTEYYSNKTVASDCNTGDIIDYVNNNKERQKQNKKKKKGEIQ